MESANKGSPTQERLIGDLRLVIENAEDLLKSTDQYTGTVYEDARARLAAALDKATGELERFEEVRLASMIKATRAASELYGDCSGEARLMRAFR